MHDRLPRASSADRALLAAMVFSWVIHGVALLAMITVLDPGVNMQAAVAERARYVAAHPERWRYGWLTWQLTAVSDALVSSTLVAAAWRSAGRRWAVFGLIATGLAILPDQIGEYLMVTSQIGLAGSAAGGGAGLEEYLRMEAMTLFLTGTLGCAGYAAMSYGWLRATALMTREARAGVRDVPLERVRAPGLTVGQRWDALCGWHGGHVLAFERVGAALCGIFALCALTNGMATWRASVAGGYPGFGATFALNALAFPVLMLWMAWMTLLAASAAQWSGDPAREDQAVATTS